MVVRKCRTVKSTTLSPRLTLEPQKLTLSKLVPFARMAILSSRAGLARFVHLFFLFLDLILWILIWVYVIFPNLWWVNFSSYCYWCFTSCWVFVFSGFFFCFGFNFVNYFLSGFMWLFVLLIEAVIFGWLKLSLCGPPIKTWFFFALLKIMSRKVGNIIAYWVGIAYGFLFKWSFLKLSWDG